MVKVFLIVAISSNPFNYKEASKYRYEMPDMNICERNQRNIENYFKNHKHFSVQVKCQKNGVMNWLKNY